MSLLSLLLSMIGSVDCTNIGETVEDNIRISNLQKTVSNHIITFILDSTSTKYKPYTFYVCTIHCITYDS